MVEKQFRKDLKDAGFIQTSKHIYKTQDYSMLKYISLVTIFNRVTFRGNRVYLYKESVEVCRLNLREIKYIRHFSSKFDSSFHVVERRPFTDEGKVDEAYGEEVERLMKDFFKG